MNNKLLTIRRKVLLVAILPALCLAILLSFYFITQRSHDVEQTLHQEIANLGEYIAKNSEFDLLTGNFEELTKSLNRVSQQNAIIYIKILDKNNQVVASTDKRNNKSTALSKAALTAQHMFEIAHPVITTQVDINDYQMERDTQQANGARRKETIGRVIIGATNFFADEMKQNLATQALLITGIAITFTIFIAILLAQTVSKPLTLLAQGIEKIKGGNLQHRIQERSSGEIGILEKNINEMATSLDKAQAIERRQAANLLQSERIKAHTTLESIGEGVITTNENSIGPPGSLRAKDVAWR